MKQVLLEASGISRSYGDLQVLSPTDIFIREGDYLAISGPSGSGKSTLLNVMGLLDRPTEGTLFIGGECTERMSDAKLSQLRGQWIGFVFQSFHLLSSRTASENVELGLVYQRVARAERSGRVAQALERVGMNHRLHAFPDTLSGGEKQRVAIARAIASGVRLVLADEPTGNLDLENGSMIVRVLEGMVEQGVAVVIITHDESLANRATRHLRMKDGHLVERVPDRAVV